MTIRNAVPQFGIRWAVALAAVTAVVIAALLAVGSPVSAQSSDGDEIWSATITVGNEGSGFGYYNRASSQDYGSIDDDSIPSPRTGSDYTVAILNDTAAFNNSVIIAVAPQLHDDDRDAMTLHIGARTFDLDNAAVVADGNLYAYQFRNIGTRIGWAVNDEVAVKITALPIVTIEAVTTTVEYGGNDNAADSVAEFRFTRYGSTDEALSFRLNHSGPGFSESLTRTFNAGQSSFSNFHWAVQVDNNGLPQCFISWQIFERSHYVRGTPASALVTVEGPGTTCMSGI